MGHLVTVEDVCTFYTQVLTAAGLIVRPDGGVYIKANRQELPLPVGGKNLVIPTKENLSQGFGENQPFAPLGESINRTESVVLKKLRQILTVRQTTVLGSLMSELMTIAADVTIHKTLTPTQSELLSVVPEVDEKTVKAVGQVFDVIDPLGDKRLVSTYIKRNGIVDGMEYMRAAIVSVDIMRALVEKEATIYGKAMRVKDKKAFFALLEFILPGCKDPAKFYSAGSKDKIAPNFHALLTSHLNIMEALNRIVDLFRDKIEGAEELYTPDISVLRDKLEDLKQFNGLVPALQGNMGEGESGVGEAEAATTTEATTTRATIGQASAAALAAKTAPAVTAPVVASQVSAAPMTYAQQQAARQAQYYAANPQLAPRPLSPREQYELDKAYANQLAAAPVVPHQTIGQSSGYVGYQQAQTQQVSYNNYAPVVAPQNSYVPYQSVATAPQVPVVPYVRSY